MSDDENTEKPVEVVLPDEPITEIELSDTKAEIKEEPPKVKVKDDVEPSPSKPVVDEREKALNDLRKQYERQKQIADAEREARKQAEEYARQRAQEVHYTRSEVQDSNLRLILNAIDATEQAASSAERDYAEAMAAQNYQGAAEAQRAISRAEAHLLQLQNGKQKLEEQLQQMTTEGSVREQNIPSFEPNVPQDPVEQYAARLTPKSAQWLRNHPEIVSNNKVGKLTRAHQDAVEDGIQPESPEYFQYIESRLGYSAEPQYEEQPRAVEPPAAPARKTVASAPVTSSAAAVSSRSNGNSNTMTLSAAEVEMAILAEPELSRDRAIESYARNKAYLIKQGKLSA